MGDTVICPEEYLPSPTSQSGFLLLEVIIPLTPQ